MQWRMQAPNFSRSTDFAADEVANVGGRSTVKTDRVNAELDTLGSAYNALNANVQLNQRDDGEIRDQRVKLHTLAPDVLKLVTAGGSTLRGPWVTATAYALKDVVTQSGNTYVCAIAHTSGTFATDLTANRWVLLQLGAATAASGVPFSPTGTLAGANVQAAIEEADTENRALNAAEAAARVAADALIRSDLAASGGSALVGFLQTGTGAVARTAQAKNRESISLLDFIPVSLHAAILDYTSSADHTSYILAAFAAANGRDIVASAGKYNHTALTFSKSLRFALTGEFCGYDAGLGTVFNYTGSGVGLQIGVDDGNPDITGPNRNCHISNIHFTTTSGQTAIRVQNTALVRIHDCATRAFSGKVIDVHASVITMIYRNDIFGSQPSSGNYGIWLDEQYFGNFVTKIEHNHIGQLNHAGRFSEGRSLLVQNNTVENIRPPSGTGVWEFQSSGYISNCSIRDNYYENHRGYVYGGSTYTGLVLNLEIKSEESWGSDDAGNVNPGVGNLLRTRVLNSNIVGNFYIDSSYNSAAGLGMAAVFPTTSIFNSSQTIIRDSVVGREYSQAIQQAFIGNELLKSSGDFTIINAGTPGSLTVAGSSRPSVNGAAASAPLGWTSIITGAVWNSIVDDMTGAWVCYTPASGTTFDLASKVVSLTPVATTRYFVMAVTTKGWASVRVNGTLVFDTAASTAAYVTNVFKFSIAPSAANFTLGLGTNASASYWAEARLYEIGLAEYTEAGGLGFSMFNAALRTMRRGIYN